MDWPIASHAEIRKFSQTGNVLIALPIYALCISSLNNEKSEERGENRKLKKFPRNVLAKLSLGHLTLRISQ